MSGSKDSVTAVVAAIPPRRQTFLPESLAGINSQTHPLAAISVAFDVGREGAGPTRQRAVDAASTEWVAVCDDDDVWYPHHVESLLTFALSNDLDYAYSYWDLTRTPDILGHFGRVFDPSNPTHTTSVILVKTDLVKTIKYRPPQPGCAVSNEDMHFTLDCVAAGAKIAHLPIQSWYWRHHSGNTSGREDRW